jgi:hypothetical protein
VEADPIMPVARRFPPPRAWSPITLRNAGRGSLVESVARRVVFGVASGPSEFRWEIYDVAREASFEAKESGESRDGIGSRWGLVAGGWRIRGSRWSAGRYSDDEHRNYSR